ncbi:MAG: hypothetical protein J0J06_13930 [Sphingomonas sp.]|uniref:hypothetical protein n=1 Tax=Sphingomonas sp. TaxID=28214 RepID=UPI001AC3052A|nr:hypothetical protein [Sphingomonas sp.]MBN8816534.1 hypothetical protein [Sphingomonas sp.]
MSSPSSHLSLTFADSVTVLMDACGLPVSARTAFDARLRQLQRHGVPVRDDATSRIRYGIAELAAFATATKLMDAFMVPALAARYVVERWPELAPCMLAGAKNALPAGYLARRSIPSESFAVFGSNALAQMGKRHRHDERYVEPLGTVRVIDERRAAATAAAAGGAGLVLDSAMYMPTIVRQWAERLSATETEVSAELDRLRFVEE